MSVDVEVCRAAVATSSDQIGEFAERGQIVSGIKRDTVGEGESFAGVNACCYLVQFFVV
jgi:hypothetical protein